MQIKRSAADPSAALAEGGSCSVWLQAVYMDLGKRFKTIGKRHSAGTELRTSSASRARVLLHNEKVRALCNFSPTCRHPIAGMSQDCHCAAANINRATATVQT